MDKEDQDFLDAVARLHKLENPNQKTFYIYYDNDGSIKHVRNYLENDSFSYIEMSENELDISKFNPDEYCILNENNQMKLFKIERIFDNLINIKDIIYEIPKISTYTEYTITDEDLIVEQNSWNKKFKISLSKKWIDMFGHLKNIRKNIILYVTAEQDPNILYKTLNAPVEKLIISPVIVEYDDFIDCSCSIYGTKYFEKYVHIHYA